MDLLKILNSAQKKELSEKEAIVERLLMRDHIDFREAAILLKTIDISISAEKLEMSSGAKIVGGSDFEQNNR